MITKSMWIVILKEIRCLKDGVVNPRYYRKERDRKDATLNAIATTLITPVTILIDLATLPIQLIYLIVYKLLWKN